MKEIKIDDYVLVAGEANEVFQVVEIMDKAVVLSTGVIESKTKCTLIPKKFHNELYTISTTYIYTGVIRQIQKEDEAGMINGIKNRRKKM